ncbi:alternative ribosome rescue aminoacyl-tRNA hydrolase ArfB [Flavobacteriales bacterium]|nr:alternative ribosome rescue aminoacyl-tRNA hydrolase ArfB [Flavobacteriales bacterium]
MNKSIILKELNYKAIRSSGAGGQHVNKVSSKVVLTFDVTESKGLSNREKGLLSKNLASRLTNDQKLIISCDDKRSQFQNKNLVTDRFFQILERGLYVAKKRIASKPSKNSIKRMKDKKNKRSDLKKTRRKPDLD